MSFKKIWKELKWLNSENLVHKVVMLNWEKRLSSLKLKTKKEVTFPSNVSKNTEFSISFF